MVASRFTSRVLADNSFFLTVLAAEEVADLNRPFSGKRPRGKTTLKLLKGNNDPTAKAFGHKQAARVPRLMHEQW